MKKKIMLITKKTFSIAAIAALTVQTVFAAYVTDPNSLGWSKRNNVSIFATDNVEIVGITYTKENVQPEASAAWSPVQATSTPAEAGDVVDGYKASFTFSNDSDEGDGNGTYYAWCVDKAGNVSSEGIPFKIAKIDDVAPTVTTSDLVFSLTQVEGTYTDITPISSETAGQAGTYVYLPIKIGDNESGVKSLRILDSSSSELVNRSVDGEGEALPNGTYVMKFSRDNLVSGTIEVTDIVGNKSATSFTIDADSFDTVAPEITNIELDTLDYVGRDLTVTVTAEDNLGDLGKIEYAIITKSEFERLGGTIASVVPELDWQDSNEFTVTTNDEYVFVVRDEAGNASYESKEISNIDKTAPTINSIIITELKDLDN